MDLRRRTAEWSNGRSGRAGVENQSDGQRATEDSVTFGDAIVMALIPGMGSSSSPPSVSAQASSEVAEAAEVVEGNVSMTSGRSLKSAWEEGGGRGSDDGRGLKSAWEDGGGGGGERGTW